MGGNSGLVGAAGIVLLWRSAKPISNSFSVSFNELATC